MNIPTTLTWMRIVLTFVLVLIFYFPVELISQSFKDITGGLVFGIAAITDAFDGYIARKYNMTTPFGAFLDSIADKILVCTAIAILLYLNRIDLIIAIIIIGREIAVTALREWMSKIGKAASVKVNWHGKFKAIAQMIAIPLLFFYNSWLGFDLFFIGTFLIYIATLLTIWSMLVYFKAAIDILNNS